MLPKTTVNAILELALSKGADFAEVFAEESNSSSISLLDKKIDTINSGNAFGVGVRLLQGADACYGYSSDVTPEALLTLTANLARSLQQGGTANPQALRAEAVEDRHVVARDPEGVPKSDRVDLLRQLDELTRGHGAEVRQVGASVTEKRRTVLIANSEGRWVEDSRQYSRISLAAIAEKDGGPQTASESPGVLGGYEFFQGLDLERLAESAATSAMRMAGAGYIDGGTMPVVLGNGFGGVIFHEACGHPLETEAVRFGGEFLL